MGVGNINLANNGAGVFPCWAGEPILLGAVRLQVARSLVHLGVQHLHRSSRASPHTSRCAAGFGQAAASCPSMHVSYAQFVDLLRCRHRLPPSAPGLPPPEPARRCEARGGSKGGGWRRRAAGRMGVDVRIVVGAHKHLSIVPYRESNKIGPKALHVTVQLPCDGANKVSNCQHALR